MKVFWFLIHMLFHLNEAQKDERYFPAIEKEHDPQSFTSTMTPNIMGTEERIPDPLWQSPDYRIEEPLWVPYYAEFTEEERPYRMTPAYYQLYRWDQKTYDKIASSICYCTTVYKRLTLLAGCAVITTRHVLTTASSTWLILRSRIKYKTMENILGIWYETSHGKLNASMYATPARIHFHPLFHLPEHVNRSHPLPFTFDLAVWATTYNFYGWYLNSNSISTCLRSTSHSSDQRPATPPTVEIFILIGFQFMYAYQKKPMAWYKYGVRTRKSISPCPKTEWGWYLCIPGDWAKYGMDNGAALHRSFEDRAWTLNGLIAINAFSMKLRSLELIHYFTILDVHVVLDWLYDAYFGYQKKVWIDARFNDTRGRAPMANFYIDNSYPSAEQPEWYTVPIY